MKNKEQILLEQVRRGNEKAFKKLFYLYGDRFYLWSYKITKNSQAAEDIVQDFFVRYWEKRKTLFFYPSFAAYAYRAMYNASLNYIRDNERFISGYEITIDLMDMDVEDEDLQELKRLLLKAIDELPDRCKKIFVMATLEKKKYTEVADLLGISVNTVKVQVSKAYRILKEKIG
ncbi:RNA polymerase sigma-70 factor (ECF subfamily) [Parabacteroides sp. PF5-5]|uniref:RNA polymerase sigma-70 factor n=1 Tax=unclassified Parabacteroides TaxID=2649774 RepID=UPI002475AEF9|nr:MULTISPECIES: RNA polymerase sigma-70 factor [unclassified Parabacteroides]MDH6304920.1 RNA polymerase sigma-70 factor (ECF subfamily) [Parabacteroides sp. PH5-39]MDH6315994.1 RNA polymerase sigma-70 factor (ECF subfamily) [Parabacteroides sp. PF5-13]MDH6319651.1 RNA polymerase sigma-70 factor (ECF subfamily) [Parabacteroides sp. PH5-13]MDH6323382.1 RNA polymerase sigma-70 factor (ECF subfamily) [Parabacteroides sp. PH5-8]MDH6327109.1 RNA polymerase sigma-70 factor (ECF subfamily) [Parabact